MEKDMSAELNPGSNEVSLLPYTAPELRIYNHSKITMGGKTGIPIVGDFTPGGSGGTSYKNS